MSNFWSLHVFILLSTLLKPVSQIWFLYCKNICWYAHSCGQFSVKEWPRFPLFPQCTAFLQTSQARKIKMNWMTRGQALQRHPKFSYDIMCANAKKKSLCSDFSFSDHLWSLHKSKPESSKGHRVREQRKKRKMFSASQAKVECSKSFHPTFIQLTIFYKSVLWHLLYETVQRCIDASNADAK